MKIEFQKYIEEVKERLDRKLRDNGLELGYANIFLEPLQYGEIKEIRYFYKLIEETRLSDDVALKRMMLRKHKAFSSEREERVVWAFDKEKRKRLEDLFANESEDLKYDKEDESWYLRFPLTLIMDIYVGPLFDSKIEEIEDLIKRNEMKKRNVILSGIPYARTRQKI